MINVERFWCEKCGRFTKQPKICSNTACRKPMCGRHTDFKKRCPTCHEEAINPRNRRPWLQQEPCAHCGALFSIVQLAQHQSNCEQRPRRCPFYVASAENSERPVRRCDFYSRSEADALPHLQAKHLDEFINSFYEFCDPRAPGEHLVLLSLASHLLFSQNKPERL